MLFFKKYYLNLILKLPFEDMILISNYLYLSYTIFAHSNFFFNKNEYRYVYLILNIILFLFNYYKIKLIYDTA